MNSYDQVRADWEKLWSIDSAHDMTGGYVDSEDLERMLKTPTKKMAASCMTRQIDHWFSVGTESCGPSEHFINSDSEVRDIAERYGHI